jgi:hypothetical protein
MHTNYFTLDLEDGNCLFAVPGAYQSDSEADLSGTFGRVGIRLT